MDYRQKIEQKLRDIANRNILTQEERAVMRSLYVEFVGRTGKKITQRQLANTHEWMGCHPTHESDIMKNTMETTLRKVRQVIRDLRIKHSIPILSSRSGYWICLSESEAFDYMNKLELEAKSQAKAWYETYSCMKKTLTVTSDYFEKINVIT